MDAGEESVANGAWRDYPPRLLCEPAPDRTRLLPEYPHVTGVLGWRLRRNPEPKTAYETYVEPGHHIVSRIRLRGRAVALRSVGRHRRTITGIGEHPTCRPRPIRDLVAVDHAYGDSPPDILFVLYGQVVGVSGCLIGETQPTSERLHASSKQADKVLDVAYQFAFSGRLVGEREAVVAVQIHA